LINTELAYKLGKDVLGRAVPYFKILFQQFSAENEKEATRKEMTQEEII
jgi:hypothetical protein